uniref:transmembrane protein 107-like n=1 Tax=Myxine glutinosa TaxID=7769 RepID=UPI00358E4F8A
MQAVRKLFAIRFLSLTAHLIILILILWAKEETAFTCLPYVDAEVELKAQNIKLTVALSLSLGLLGFEIIGFFSISLLNATQSLFSITLHVIATTTLTFFLFDQPECNLLWWLFGFCSIPPAISELAIMVAVLAFNQKPF